MPHRRLKAQSTLVMAREQLGNLEDLSRKLGRKEIRMHSIVPRGSILRKPLLLRASIPEASRDGDKTAWASCRANSGPHWKLSA
jgi:hypothetical protein